MKSKLFKSLLLGALLASSLTPAFAQGGPGQQPTFPSVTLPQFSAPPPTVTGTGTPVLATGSTDAAGEVTAGTSATSVVITFSSAKANAPFCVVRPQAQITSFAYTVSVSAITITQTSTSSNLIDYTCTQH